ncbi:MAG TPA: alkaline phosphatase D family protein [Pirellulales bacterium]|nr:alkaline phosphatase D family protein [Pirellulales bacterium]
MGNRNLRRGISRRQFVVRSATATTTAANLGRSQAAEPTAAAGPGLAMGTRVGEVTDTSAIVWARLTARPSRNADGPKFVGHVNRKEEQPPIDNVDALFGACPGMAGRLRVRYRPRKVTGEWPATPWADVSGETDFSHQFPLVGLSPATPYEFEIDTTPEATIGRGRFETAPAAATPAEVCFCVTTCLMVADLDHEDGFQIFPAMQALEPRFVVFTGDSVYFDSERPRAESIELARYHWQRMYSLPRHTELLRKVASYWEKDDHDTHSDDSWPAMRPMGTFTFAQGQQVYHEYVPLAGRLYRTFRWGSGLQVWFTDGRDFRSPNNMPDGPDKTIWGVEQKAWLKQTLATSAARWKVLVSPTPIVGPDRKTKNDNHSNAGFTHEGDEFRQWVRDNVAGNFFVVCGDRHWQYHSVHPATGLNEFACGPGSDVHASGSPGYNAAYHKFHRVKGGFLSVLASPERISFRHHDVRGQIVYQWQPG